MSLDPNEIAFYALFVPAYFCSININRTTVKSTFNENDLKTCPAECREMGTFTMRSFDERFAT